MRLRRAAFSAKAILISYDCGLLLRDVAQASACVLISIVLSHSEER